MLLNLEKALMDRVHLVGAISKVWRFICIYGLGKTWFKVTGRFRTLGGFIKPQISRFVRDTAVIGCGHFSFATIGHSVCRHFGNRFIDCFDISAEAKQSFARFYQIAKPSCSVEQLLENPEVNYVYIASNHASHSDYAIAALEHRKVVYIEKPIAVSYPQLHKLLDCVNEVKGVIYAGYNRPFSAALLDLKAAFGKKAGPMTLNCFVSAHQIAPDHWYRMPEEGTRVCGNIGHWIDLAIHMLSWGDIPDRWQVTLASSDANARDDDLSISMISDEGDLVVITLTSRCEPFEGINETINFQCENTICKIDDFRRMTIWQGENLIEKKYWPKDVGHNLALLQPYVNTNRRDWNEVVMSTLMMLHITDMVRIGQRYSVFSFSDAFRLHLACQS